MRFKKIELYGFKSFADKTVIEFDSGITAIVGPNGCGKSNVGDAVKWVLGSQSPKAMRSESMVDVIFNGTDSRKKSSYCEVSLFFDNTDRSCKLNSDEIIITRKLNQDRISGYFINGESARLSDITELFRDTGVGKEGYSIIGQGKIDEILSQKPDERRKIFEEAAGITRKKAKKQETEKMLDKAHSDILAIGSNLRNMQENLVVLEKEAGEARRSKELKVELKANEINQFVHYYENSHGKRTEIEMMIEDYKNQYNMKKSNLDQVVGNYNKNMMDITNTDIYLNRLRDEMTELMVNSEKISGDNRALHEKLNGLKNENQNLNDDREELTEKLTVLESKLGNAIVQRETKFNTLQEKLKEQSEFNSVYTALDSEVQQKYKEIEKTNDFIKNNLGKLSDIKANAVKYIATQEILKENILKVKDELKVKKAKMKVLQDDKAVFESNLSSINSDNAIKIKQKNDADMSFYKCVKEIREIELKAKTYSTSRTELEVRLRILKENKEGYLGYASAVRGLMSVAKRVDRIKSLIVGVVGEVVTVPKEYQTAIEIALGNSIQNIITSNEHDASALIDYLKEERLGRATFMPLTTVKSRNLDDRYIDVLDEPGCVGIASEIIRYDKSLKNIFNSLLGAIVIVENKEYALKIARKFNYGFRIVTLDGENFASSGAITGGSASGNERKVLSLDSEIDEISKKLKRIVSDESIITADINERYKERDNFESIIRTIEAQIHKIELEANGISQRLISFDKDIIEVKGEIDSLEAKIAADSSSVDELSSLIKMVDKEKGAADDQTSSADDLINNAKNAYFEKKGELEILQRKLTSVTVAVQKLQSEVEALDVDINRMKHEFDESNSRLRIVNAKLVESVDAIKIAQSMIDVTIFSVDDKERLGQIENELKLLETHKEEMKASLVLLDEQRNGITESMGKLTELKLKEESNLEKIDGNVLNLANRVKEEYDLDYEACIEFKVENFEIDKAQTTINRLKRQIDNLGAVNALAEEKFEQESIGFDDLKKQYDDVVQAEKDLQLLISDLTKEMEIAFNKSFAQINENYKVIFSKLFGGGRGELRLDYEEEDDNSLTCGIEIMAQPAGKTLKNIMQLSGGEKALSAIAILFAIIKLKPMPFCILDEIEAALDEHNVYLFAEYMRKFVHNTQFIVVTHRKPTMELADRLYGITMQEKGVSNMVSTRLVDIKDDEVFKGKEKDNMNENGITQF